MSIKKVSRFLRTHQTHAEEVLWERLQNRRCNSKKFLRRHPILFTMHGKQRFFIADFYCAEHRLVIEIDGTTHEQQKEHDEAREWIIRELGYGVVRFTNEEIEHSIEDVITMVKLLTPVPPLEGEVT